MCFPSATQTEHQAISCMETLTSYLSACRLHVYVVINLPLRSQGRVTAATLEVQTALATTLITPFPVLQSARSQLWIGSWESWAVLTGGWAFTVALDWFVFQMCCLKVSVKTQKSWLLHFSEGWGLKIATVSPKSYSSCKLLPHDWRKCD